MPTNTPNLDLVTYNGTTDGSSTFLQFRTDIAGITNSNATKIDDFAGEVTGSLATLIANNPLMYTPASGSANYYTATVSGFVAYDTNIMINFVPNTTNSGSVTININSLGIKTMSKYDTSGCLADFSGGELTKNREYLFRYNGARFIWIASQTDEFFSTASLANGVPLSGSTGRIDNGWINTNVTGSLAYGFPSSGSTGKINNAWLNTGEGNGLDADTLDGYHASNFIGDLSAINGRLTLMSGCPISGSISSASILYFSPYNGNRISLYDNSGSKWLLYNFDETALNIVAYTEGNYDVFTYKSISGSGLVLECSIWASGSLRTTELAKQDGIYVKTGEKNKRYVGTIRYDTSASGIVDTPRKRFVYNYYNKQLTSNKYYNDNPTYTVSSNTTFTQFPNDGGARIEFVDGMGNAFYQLGYGFSLRPVSTNSVAIASGSSGGLLACGLNGNWAALDQYIPRATEYPSIGTKTNYILTTIPAMLGYNYFDGMVANYGLGYSMYYYYVDLNMVFNR